MDRWARQARDDVRGILQRMLAAVDPQPVLRSLPFADGMLALPDGSNVRLDARRVRLAAVGKGAARMAAHAERWGPFAEAVVVAPRAFDRPGFESWPGTHPEPGAGSVAAGERLLRLAAATGPDDLLILLLSGGASALAEAPDIPLEYLARVTRLLLHASADVAEVNTVRRHLSRLKGGGLLRACRGEVLVLAISDVPPGDAASLGSGPASADATTFQDALDVLRRHGLTDAAPRSVLAHLEAGARGEVRETLKPGDPALGRVRAFVLADNDTALRAGADAAARRGYDVRVLPGFLQGEARQRGRELATMARAAVARPGRPVAILAGGETVVRVEGSGKGGRNQEVALAAVDGLSGLDAMLACVGTDGVDGPTDAAGAVVDGMTRARAEARGLDAEAFIQENDAYRYFDALDDLVRTGPTGTNARDVAVLLVRPQS